MSAPCLIRIIHPVAERRRLEVERHGASVGGKVGELTHQHICHAVKRVGGKTVARRERSYTVKSAVENAVAVYGEKCFHIIPPMWFIVFSIPLNPAAVK